jgi:hypothetical protein
MQTESKIAIANQVVEAIQKAIPYTCTAILDDIGGNSFHAFISFPYSFRCQIIDFREMVNLFTVGSKIRNTFKKMKDVTLENVVVPKKQYKNIEGKRFFQGYTSNKVCFNFRVLT